MAQRDDLLRAGVDLRQHDRGLVGLGARGGEECSSAARPGVMRASRSASSTIGSVGIERRDVPEAVDLRLDGVVDARVAVADRDGQDAAEEVEVLAAVGVAARAGPSPLSSTIGSA